VVLRIKEKYPLVIKFGYIVYTHLPICFQKFTELALVFYCGSKKGEVKELARPPLLALSQNNRWFFKGFQIIGTDSSLILKCLTNQN